MDKTRAIELFGGQHETAEAIGCTWQAVHKWPDPLPRRIADRVIAAAVRLHKRIPSDLLEELRA